MHLTDVITCALVGAYVLLATIFPPKPNLPLLTAPLLLAVAGIVMALGSQDLADQLGLSVFYLLVGASALVVIDHINKRTRSE